MIKSPASRRAFSCGAFLTLKREIRPPSSSTAECTNRDASGGDATGRIAVASSTSRSRTSLIPSTTPRKAPPSTTPIGHCRKVAYGTPKTGVPLAAINDAAVRNDRRQAPVLLSSTIATANRACCDTALPAKSALSAVPARRSRRVQMRCQYSTSLGSSALTRRPPPPDR
jgi:hypothetical protein